MDILKSFSFVLPTRIEFGIGSVGRLAEEIKSLGAERPLIVTDKGIIDSGILERITVLMDEAGIKHGVYSDVAPNPRDENVHKGAETARDLNSDCLIAVGGGSSIDCAKGISIVAVQGGKIQSYRGVEKVPGGVLPIIAIPTTAGSGSEVTFSSVITDWEMKTKFSLRSTKIAARVAICDPELTVTMPKSLTAATGMDALTHAIEGYTATCAEPIANAAALYSITLISENLRRAVSNGSDVEARAGMLMGSLLGAISFSHSDVAAVHCIAEALGGMYDKPHGECNAICLPEVMDYSKSFCINKYANIAKAMGLSFSSDEGGATLAVAETRRLSEDVGIPSFKMLGIQESKFSEIARKSYENLSNSSNPRPLSINDYIEILSKLNSK
ncbi:MAG: iron-containing alcohol dehydrogenase [Synergistaceae bacterium]|nr:iron-containing alcohol dehydrogenase [Synergistaceae bacterium]